MEATLNRQKFFGSFFQKRTACFAILFRRHVARFLGGSTLIPSAFGNKHD
jgi:hypothetical protein